MGKEGFCQGKSFRAPLGGSILCAPVKSTSVIPRGKPDSRVEPGQRCKIICDAAYPIPESTSCAVTGWTVKSEDVRCDATKNGLSPAGQMGVVGAFLIVVCLVTAIYQYKKSKPQVRPIREPQQQTFVQHQIQNYQHVRPQLHQNT